MCLVVGEGGSHFEPGGEVFGCVGGDFHAAQMLWTLRFDAKIIRMNCLETTLIFQCVAIDCLFVVPNQHVSMTILLHQ